MNHIKTFFLMALLTVILLLAGEMLGGPTGLTFALGLALVLNFFAYWFSDKIAVTMTRSKQVTEKEAPDVYRALKELTHKEGMPMPRVYIMPSEQPNAFAAGRNPDKSVVSVTQGLQKMLNYEELKGVLAHELAHIRNRDILISTIAAVMVGALTFIARIGMWGMIFGGRNNENPLGAIIQLVALIILPIAALLIRMAVSRTREYHADATGAELAGNPHGLASALEKMERYAKGKPMKVNEAASHMFIINPLSAKGMASLFSTHPPIRQRVEKLRQMS